MLKIIKVYLELTFACNLKCKFCYVGDMQSAENQKDHALKGATLEEVYGQLQKVFCDGGEYTYDIDILGGESTLNKNIIQIVSFIKTHYTVRRFTLTTNATFLTQELLLGLQNAGISEFRVSLHGPKQIHNTLVGVDVFDKVINSLRLFSQLSIPYTMVFVVNKMNYMYISSIIDFLNQQDILPQAVFYEFVEFSGYAHQNIENLNLQYSSQVVEAVNNDFLYIAHKYPKLGFIVTNFPKCVLDSSFHHLIDDNFNIGHRYELYIPLLARKSFFGFTIDEQKALLKHNLQRGYKVNFQKKLEEKFIPDACFSCRYQNHCYLLVRETILHDYLQKDFLKRKHYFELNPKISPGK